jgi:predicted O-methyltransferase YrrM
MAPTRLRDDPRVRAAAVGLGLIPPRAMHAQEEMDLLSELASGARRVVEIGVYEGASAVHLCRSLPPAAELHLIDPFGKQPGALPRDWAATEWATKRIVARAARGGPRVAWHVERSEDTARTWTAGEADLVFVDGDHLEPGVRLDWELWREHVRPGGWMLFHDAREGKPHGRGLPGPTAVVDSAFRGAGAVEGWRIEREVDRTVAVRRVV